MGVFSTMADEKLVDATQAQIMFTDEVMYESFIHVTQQTTMNNRDPLRVTNTNSGRKKQLTG